MTRMIKDNINWDIVEHFKPSEFAPEIKFKDNWMIPCPEQTMNKYFVYDLNTYRASIITKFDSPVRFIIHKNGGFDLISYGRHSKKGFHPLGRAVDGHISVQCEITKEWEILSIVTQAILAYVLTGFSIGIYPFWNQPGLHLDNRNNRVFWVQERDGTMQYFTKDNFDKAIDLTFKLKEVR